MSYVDGFVVPVPKKKRAAYVAMARKACKVWREHGALDYRECVADDVSRAGAPRFRAASSSKPGEVVVFSYIAYKSRKHRDQVISQGDEGQAARTMMDLKAMPFDGKRMFFGGFKSVVKA